MRPLEVLVFIAFELPMAKVHTRQSEEIYPELESSLAREDVRKKEGDHRHREERR
jgi:hypothetical protein